MNKYPFIFLIISLFFVSCKEEIMLEPVSKLNIDPVNDITSDNNKAYEEIPFESIFTVRTKIPVVLKNVKEFYNKDKSLTATIISNDSLAKKFQFQVKVIGTPKKLDKDEILIKITEFDSLYSKTFNPFVFSTKSLSKPNDFKDLAKNIDFFNLLFSFNRSNEDSTITKSPLKLSAFNKTYERTYLNSLLLNLLNPKNYQLLSNAIEGQAIYNRLSNTNATNDIQFTFKKNSSSSYELGISNSNSSQNFYSQTIDQIDQNYKQIENFRVSIDPASWIIDGVEKKPIDILPVKKLLANLSEIDLKKGKDEGITLDSLKYNDLSTFPTTFFSDKLDSTAINPILSNFTKVLPNEFPVQISAAYKFANGFIKGFYETFLTKPNEVVVLYIKTNTGKKYSILYKTASSLIDPNKLIYQVHFKNRIP